MEFCNCSEKFAGPERLFVKILTMYPKNLTHLGEIVRKEQHDSIELVEIKHQELVITGLATKVPVLVDFLKKNSDCQFTTLVDITAVDYPRREKRFDVVYHLLSMNLNQRIRVKVSLAEEEMMPTLVGLFPSANWFEREVFDMYGIPFAGHPDLRRILTDYGFKGYPLRKDFPLTGFNEVRYDEVQKKVVYEPVELVQEFRDFDFESPWEGMGEVIQKSTAGSSGEEGK